MLEVKKEDRAPEIETMRKMIKDRGRYLYFLVTAAKKRHLDWEDFSRQALTEYASITIGPWKV